MLLQLLLHADLFAGCFEQSYSNFQAYCPPNLGSKEYYYIGAFNVSLWNLWHVSHR